MIFRLALFLLLWPYSCTLTSMRTMYNVMIYFWFLQQSDVTLQMVFFDGEEAFVKWSQTDSLYGARHLAEQWSNTHHPKGSSTTMIDTIVSILFFFFSFASNLYYILKQQSIGKVWDSNATFNSQLLTLLDISLYEAFWYYAMVWFRTIYLKAILVAQFM